MLLLIFFFTDTVNTAIYTLSLHDALPIYSVTRVGLRAARRCWIQFVQRAAQIQRDGIDERIAGSRDEGRKSRRDAGTQQMLRDESRNALHRDGRKELPKVVRRSHLHIQ